MADELAGDSYRVVKGLYTRIDPDRVGANQILSIECNWCDAKESVFFKGPTHKMHDKDWIAEAIVHLTSEHRDKMKS